MENILNHNRNVIYTVLDNSEYWDFHLRRDNADGGLYCGGIAKDGLYAYIDASNKDSITFDGEKLVSIASNDSYIYPDAINKGITLNNIGLTGMDNGMILFDKDTITKEEFLNLYTNSQLEIKNTDGTSLTMFPVDGNNKRYRYDIEYSDEEQAFNLNGGFLQNFFKSGDDCQYQILPDTFSGGISMEFVVKPKDKSGSDSGSDALPSIGEATGANNYLFYIGTRAENKFARYYNGTDDTKVTTASGIPLYQDNLTSFETDNKYLIFDRSCDGMIASKWEEGTTAKITIEDKGIDGNYFTVFNRSCDGLLAKDVDSVIDKRVDYDINKDLYRNAFGIYVGNNGTVGYRYLVQDCEGSDDYKMEGAESRENVVMKDKWNVIHLKVITNVLENKQKETMRLLLFVNGQLVLVSKALPMLNLRMLKDNPEKQEGVAYNISLGGGSQGLMDVVYDDFLDGHTDFGFGTIGKEFGGSFNGYFRSFKFYGRALTYNEILCNYRTEINS